MMFRVVTGNGNIMPPLNFPHGLRLNTEVNIKFLEKVELPWIKRLTDRRLSIWQQDSALCNTNRRTQCWLSENFCEYITPNIKPPNSPDCNPLDYYVWVVNEQKPCKTPSNTKDELKARIMTAFSNLNQETIKKVSRRFWSHLETVGCRITITYTSVKSPAGRQNKAGRCSVPSLQC